MLGLGWWQDVFTGCAQRRAARLSLHVLTIPKQAYVENGIRPVVDVLNRFGLTTVASCEGHPWRSMQPYVMFRAPLGVAARIERFLRAEEVNASSGLRASWFVVPAFDTHYELAFSIVGRGGVAEPTLLGLRPSPRKRLDLELLRLAEKLNCVLGQVLLTHMKTGGPAAVIAREASFDDLAHAAALGSSSIKGAVVRECGVAFATHARAQSRRVF